MNRFVRGRRLRGWTSLACVLLVGCSAGGRASDGAEATAFVLARADGIPVTFGEGAGDFALPDWVAMGPSASRLDGGKVVSTSRRTVSLIGPGDHAVVIGSFDPMTWSWGDGGRLVSSSSDDRSAQLRDQQGRVVEDLTVPDGADTVIGDQRGGYLYSYEDLTRIGWAAHDGDEPQISTPRPGCTAAQPSPTPRSAPVLATVSVSCGDGDTDPRSGVYGLEHDRRTWRQVAGHGAFLGTYSPDGTKLAYCRPTSASAGLPYETRIVDVATGESVDRFRGALFPVWYDPQR